MFDNMRDHQHCGLGITVWFTGLSGAGKSTIAGAVAENLNTLGLRVQMLDSDVIRPHLCRGLGFSKEDRDENVRRLGYVANLLTQHGVIVLVAAISPYRSTRSEVKQLVGSFIEVHVSTPLEICEARDTKGLYRRARAGELANLTGIDAPYEEPFDPDLRLDTSMISLEDCVVKVVERLLYRLSWPGYCFEVQ